MGDPNQIELPDPQVLLKMANSLDSQLKGNVQLPPAGEGGSNSPQPPMTKDMMMKMLTDPKIPQEIKDQFSPLVKQNLKEYLNLKERNTASGEIFKGLSFKIDHGKTIGIVGETGAGKSTLVKLIPRFYEIQSGKIAVDDIDIKDVRKSELRSKIGMVPQDSFLFSDTIEENLLYGLNTSISDEAKQAARERMIKISQFLGLDNFIQKMPEGYQTRLLENASNVSIGQRQLIAFARILILDPKILILDEATSSVDPYTETLIQDALDKVRTGRTTLIIAHRLSTIKNADEIFVIDDGQLIECGTHEELMQKNGKYAQLVQNQASV